MELNISDSEKIVEVWLSNAEKSDIAFRRTLEPLYDKYNQRKYKIAVFESGNSDLQSVTAGLLLHNRKCENHIE